MAAQHLREKRVPQRIAFIGRHQSQPRLDLTSNHEGRFGWPIAWSLQLDKSKDHLVGQVCDLVLNCEGLVYADLLNLTFVFYSDLEGPCDEVNRRASHTAGDEFSSFAHLVTHIKLNQIALRLLLLERAPVEVQLREKLYLLKSVELLQGVDLVDDGDVAFSEFSWLR